MTGKKNRHDKEKINTCTTHMQSKHCSDLHVVSVCFFKVCFFVAASTTEMNHEEKVGLQH